MKNLYYYLSVIFLISTFATLRIDAANNENLKDDLSNSSTIPELSNPFQPNTPLPGLPATKGATYITTTDNVGDGGVGAADNDMDVSKGENDPVEFFIDVTGALPTFSAVLTIYAKDVDEEDGEVNHVYFNGHFLGKMSGENNKWNTTSFTIPDLSWVKSGNNLVEYLIDVGGDATNWKSTLDWGQLVIDGGGATMADVTELEITDWNKSGTDVNINVGVSVTASETSTYKVEANLIDFNDNNLKTLNQSFSVDANQTVVKSFAFDYSLNDESGLYRIEVNLFDVATSVQQTMQKLEFYHVAGSGLNTSPVFGGISDKTINSAGATTINFTVNDSEQDPSTITVSVSSSNQSVIPDANIVLGGSGTNRTISLTPIAEGNARITLTASDGQTSSTTGFYATAVVINEPPVIQNISKTISEDDLYTFTSSNFTSAFSDADNDNLSEIKIISLPSHGTLKNGLVAININQVIAAGAIGNLNYQPAANYVGGDSFSWNASDGTDYALSAASFSFTVNGVNDVPVISEIGNQSMDEDTEKTFTVTFSDVEGGDTHTISVVSSSANVVVSDKSGNASGSTYKLTPAANWYGTADITVKVTDNSGTSDEETYTLTVNNINDTPVLTVLGNQTMDEDGSLQLGVEFSDLDPADTHLLTITSSDENVKIEEKSGNTSGSTYKIVPGANWNGTANITVSLKDQSNAEDTYSYQITVNAVNDAPVISEIGNQSMNEDTEKTLTVTFSDVEGGDTHTISVVSSSANVVVSEKSGNTSGSTYKLTPAANWYGTADITVTVTDNSGTSDQETYTLTVNNINDEPVLSVLGNQTMNEDGSLQLGVEFSDADPEDTHTLTVTSSDENVKIEEKSGNTSGSTYKVVPVENWNGTANITVTLKDQSNAEDTYSYQITVNAVNDLPVISEIGNQSMDEDTEKTLTVTFSDVEGGDTHTIGVVSSSAKVVVSEKSGNTSSSTYKLTPAENWYGTADITVKVTDNSGTSDEETYTLTVNNVNDAPVLSVLGNQTMDEDGSLQLGVEFSDADPEDTHTLTVTSSDENVKIKEKSGNTSGSTYKVVPVENWNGTADITVTLKDQDDVSDSYFFQIEVENKNDSPSMLNPGDYEYQEDQIVTPIKLKDISPGINENENISITATAENSKLIKNCYVSYDGSSSEGELSFKLGNDEFGESIVTIKLDDGQSENNITEVSFNIKVNPVNDPPSFSPLPERISMDEDAPIQTILIPDVEAGPYNEEQTLNFMVRSSNTSLYEVLRIDHDNNASTASLQLKPKANLQGNSQIVVSLMDGQAENSIHQQTINVEVRGVNDSPIISAIPSQTVDEGGQFESIDLSSYISDEETLPANIRWSFKGNKNLNVSIVDGKAAINPINQYWFGEETITFIATDEGGLQVSSQVLFAVEDVNAPPTVDDITNVVANENEEINVKVTGLSAGFGDVGQSLKVSASASNTEMIEDVIVHYTSPNNFGEIEIIPAEGRSGETQISVNVEESDSDKYTITKTFNVTILPVNDPPTMDDISPAVVNWNGGKHTMPINGITAGRFEGNQNLSLNVQAHNSTLISSINAEIQGESESGRRINNSINSSIQQSISNSATNVFYNGIISYETQRDKSGLSVVTVFLNDNENVNNFATKKTFIIVNSDPTINPVSDQQFEENEGLRNIPLGGITGGFVEDLARISVFATPLEPGLFDELSVDYNSLSTTGFLNIKPAENKSGECRVALTVKGVNSVGEEKYYTTTFNYIVNSVNNTPTIDDIADVTINEDAPEYSVLLTGISDGDPWDDQKLTFNYSISNTALFETSRLEYNQGSNTGIFSIKPAKDMSGESVVTVTLTDDGEDQLSVTKQFNIVVEKENDPPTLSTMDDITIAKSNEEKEYRIELTGISSGGAGEDDELGFKLSVPDNELLDDVRIEYDEESGKTYLVFSVKPNISDYVLIDVELYDKADPTSSITRSFAVLSGVENIPFFDSVSDQIVLEDCGEITIPIEGIRGVGSGNFVFNAVATDENLVDIAGVTYSPATGIAELKLTPKPNMNGSTEISITMKEDSSTIDRKFTLVVHSVNDQPSMVVSKSLVMNEDETATLKVTDLYSGAENEDEQFELVIWSDAQELFESINNFSEEGTDNKIIKLTPNANKYGSAILYIKIKDNGGTRFGGIDTASAIVNVTIQPVDDMPVAAIQESYSVLEDNATSPILFFVSDNDSEVSELKVKAVSLDTNIVKQDSIQIGGTGTEKYLIISPNKDVSDTSAVISVELSDGTNVNRSLVSLDIFPVNDAPYFSEQDEIVIKEDSIYELSLEKYVHDIDNDLDELKIVMNKMGTSSSNINSNSSSTVEGLWGKTRQSIKMRRKAVGTPGIMSDSIWVEIDKYKKVARIVTVANYTTPSTSLIFTVIDPAGDYGMDTLNIKILPVNDAPVLAKLPEYVTKEDSSLSLTQNEILKFVSDVDNDKSELTVNFRSNNNIPIHLDEVSGEYIINPVTNWFGTDTVFVEVSDLYSSVSGFLLVNVQSVNDMPELENETDTVSVCYDAQTSLNLFELFRDIETPDSLLEISCTVNTDSISMQYNPADGVLTLDVENELCGYYSLNVNAADESGAKISKDITIAAKYSATHWTNALPAEYILFQNYPNPFNPLTKIRYGVPIDSRVTLTVYNILGERLYQTPEVVKSAGYYEFDWNAAKYSSGIYLYIINAESEDGSQRYVKAKKMLLVK